MITGPARPGVFSLEVWGMNLWGIALVMSYATAIVGGVMYLHRDAVIPLIMPLLRKAVAAAGV